MCLLCDDEAAYKAYMDYLDAMERQGKAADPDKTVNEILDQLEAANATKANADNAKAKMNKFFADDAADDKTLSPFFCSPINK
ncbi:MULTISPECIES: hypothetical protein [Bradyrhizobium]|uniref:Uncharacterized protein n=1 Tax=Bradyrhizobium denitrificans TaxID=2734912 RepID=A0ABS5GCK7_9BRAD|nr:MULTISPECIES: hypothetical protein [Bradyrhizobium]RTM04184.1 MAG: hypothetical protein EKK32_06270 [Bradyrhizobiaceae bacterium]ABQ36739.1 hypothetical protein BBta_4712 [Bradyrhizobium sp. BTAi1]MBR1138744.1 hypothetical protein [Bradyrhizobium denitrificans]MCL8485936.1 hypothetical protein [Bradyrhizobium denitrificans]MDU1496361.1 hypothetical protein [Bradyrhizobium sp.]